MLLQKSVFVLPVILIINTLFLLAGGSSAAAADAKSLHVTSPKIKKTIELQSGRRIACIVGRLGRITPAVTIAGSSKRYRLLLPEIQQKTEKIIKRLQELTSENTTKKLELSVSLARLKLKRTKTKAFCKPQQSPAIAVLNPGGIANSDTHLSAVNSVASPTSTVSQILTAVSTSTPTGKYPTITTVLPSLTPTVEVVAASSSPTLAMPTQTPTALPTARPKIVLPIEVVDGSGRGSHQDVYIPLTAQQIQGSGLFSLHFTVYGLEFEGMGHVSINGLYQRALTNLEIETVSGKQRAFGGIGGAFSTLRLAFSVPREALKVGENMIRFAFTKTDGFVSGYKVLKLNLLRDSQRLLSDELFVDEDPSAWQPPLTDRLSIEEGKVLWHTAALKTSPLQSASIMRAKCSDCHATNGYDLKYFNFSNASITERAKFHGLTEQEGLKITSYIRSLDAPNPGRPWNPPYQPGPGMDSKPVNEWAAGAGIDAVLENDLDAILDIFPSGIPKEIDLLKTLNQREIRTSLELLPWNSWLPRVHPVDYFGDIFTRSNIRGCVDKFEDDPIMARGGIEAVRRWDTGEGYIHCIGIAALPQRDGGVFQAKLEESRNWGAAEDLASYGVAQYRAVKSWWLMRKYELEGKGFVLSEIPGSPYPKNISEAPNFTNERTWMSGRTLFNAAPHLVSMMRQEGHPLRNGSRMIWNYSSAAWYYLQAVVNDNHRTGDGATHYTYLIPFMTTTGESTLASNEPNRRYTFTAGVMLTLIKQMEAHYNRIPLATRYQSWEPLGVMFPALARSSSGWSNVWASLPDSVYRQFAEAYMRAHLRRTKAYSVEDWRRLRPEYFTPEVVRINNKNPNSGAWHEALLFTLTDFKKSGIDRQLLQEIARYGGLLWPTLSKDFIDAAS